MHIISDQSMHCAPGDEIEITPEMVEAGVEGLSSRYLDLEGGVDLFSEIVRTVYARMEQVRQKQRIEEMPEGTQVVLISKYDKFTSGYLLRPDGSRIELHPENWDGKKSLNNLQDQNNPVK